MSQLRSKKKRMVNSFVWTDEEAKYLKAVLKWKEKESLSHSDDDKRSKTPDSHPLLQHEKDTEQRQEQQKPAGEFRVLVIGAKGTGKTSILQRVCESFATPLLDSRCLKSPFHHSNKPLSSTSSQAGPSPTKASPQTLSTREAADTESS